MKGAYKYILSILPALLILFSGCSKERVRIPIEFTVMGPDINVSVETQTKGEITTDRLESVNVFVVGSENGASIFGYNVASKLTKDANRWIPSEEDTWEDDATYTFYGYAYDTPAGTSVNISESGRKIDVRQPTVYSGSGDWADYLLSEQLVYPPSKIHNLVPIHLKHAMSKVEIYVTRAKAMVDVEINKLTIVLSNIITNGTLTYSANSWTSICGTSLGNYTHSTTYNNDIKVEGSGEISPFMSFIAIPVYKSSMSDYVMEISYTTAGGESFNKTFQLGEIGNNWLSGHLITYNFIIDNGIHLGASISDWENGGIIEGTIFPETLAGE